MRSTQRVLDGCDSSRATTSSQYVSHDYEGQDTYDGKERSSQTLVEPSDQQVLHRRLALHVPHLPLDVARWIAYHLGDLQEQRRLRCPEEAIA